MCCIAHLAGCGNKADQADIAGIYTLDKTGIKDAMQKQLEEEGHPEAERGASLFGAMIENVIMRLTLNEDGTAIMYVKDLASETTGTGTWTLGANATITISVAAPGAPTETTVGDVKKNTITMRAKENDQDNMPFDLVFRRETEAD
jgi:hypothetical protein